MAFKVPEKFRRKDIGEFSSTEADGNNGIFYLPVSKKEFLIVMASDGGGWEHVSVSTPHRTPTWDEMNGVKDAFWGPEDCVIQYHPPKSDYVNNCGHCLHLWRPIGVEIPRPPKIMVGV